MSCFLHSLILVFFCYVILSSPISLNHRTGIQYFRASQSDASKIHDGIGVGSDIYTLYTGDGSADAGWPKMSEWSSFQEMYNNNAVLMKTGCTNLGLPSETDTTDIEVARIYEAIQNVATLTKVDHRFILAIMMQESLGCVRVYTSANGNANPGLMQDHAGFHSCNQAPRGVLGEIVFPCPFDQIKGMIQDGVGGTDAGDGLAGYLNALIGRTNNARISGTGSGSAQIYYQAARYYNSGSIDYTNLANAFGSRKCYASDIANRLTGWVFAPSKCNLDG